MISFPVMVVAVVAAGYPDLGRDRPPCRSGKPTEFPGTPLPEPKGRKGKTAGEPAFLQKRSSADGDKEPQTRTVLVNGEVSPALVGPTPSGSHPSGKKIIYGWR